MLMLYIIHVLTYTTHTHTHTHIDCLIEEHAHAWNPPPLADAIVYHTLLLKNFTSMERWLIVVVRELRFNHGSSLVLNPLQRGKGSLVNTEHPHTTG